MFALITVLGLALATSQSGQVTLHGVVRDAESGEPLVGAIVALTDLNRATPSGVDGRYVLRDVPAGLQHLEVRRLGYAPRALHAFVPAAGGVEIHISLQPDPLRLPGLDVSPVIAVRGADSHDDSGEYPDVSVSAAAVHNHPMLAEPDVFLALSGGVVAADPEAPHGLHVRGGRADQVTYLLDGIPVLSPYHSVGLFSAWNPDALVRLRLESAPSGVAAPDALSGVVTAETRPPGPDFSTQGAISTRQVRATMDGPVPWLNGGYLLSLRRGFPGFPAPDDEYSYVRGGSTDWLAKLEGKVGGGELRLLGYGNQNRTGAAAVVTEEDAAEEDWTVPGHRFGWAGQSIGGEWSRPFSGERRLRIRGWYATADAAVRWAGNEGGSLRLSSERGDAGGAAVLELGDSVAGTILGVRAVRSRTAYRVRDDSERNSLEAVTLVAAASVEHARVLGPTLRLETGLLGAVYDHDARLSPRLEIRWSPRSWIGFSALLARSHQAEQSLANGETVAGYLFPAALPVGAESPGVPLARSDRVSLAAEARPLPSTRFAGELYARDFRNLVLVAPVTARPFAVDGFAIGSGAASGAALELSLARARYALLGTYGYERVRFSHGDSSYVPSYAATHRLEAGAVAFPQTTTSIRVGLTGVFGRRTTAAVGPFEWEACNLMDLGCEFAGSPEQRAEPLGGTRLPAYLRLDVGARKHWHIQVGGTDAQLGLYGSVTNVLGRRNLLTRTLDPRTGEWEWIEMRSRVPLVIGLDWRF